MRLIDADALKNELSDKDYITYTHEYGDAIPVDWIMSAIDNAPTVERPTGEYQKGERKMTLNEILAVLERERECVLRQDTPDCNRDCKNCKLVLPTEKVIRAYDNAIGIIRAERDLWEIITGGRK